MTDSAELVGRLYRTAEQRADDRRVAEYGPGGGNPNAKAEDHDEWRAASLIERQEARLSRLRGALEDIRGGCFPDITTLAVAGDWHAIVDRLQAMARKALDEDKQHG